MMSRTAQRNGQRLHTESAVEPNVPIVLRTHEEQTLPAVISEDSMTSILSVASTPAAKLLDVLTKGLAGGAEAEISFTETVTVRVEEET